MNTGKRKTITSLIVDALKNINGGVSSYNSSYTYNLNLNNNVFRRFKFIDEINDFPSVYLQAGEELRIYNTTNLVEAELDIVARCYMRSSNPTLDLENLALDIEHVLYNLPTDSSIGIQDITIDSITNDEGLIGNNYGIGEVFFTVLYEL